MRFLLILVTTVCLNSYKVSAQNANITINVEGVKDKEGLIQIGLFNSKDDFPNRNKVFAGADPKAASDIVSYTFKNIPPGKYAVAIFHDKDSNRKFDKNKLGIPVEGFGFSNVNKIFGVPEFEDALFEVSSDLTVSIKLNYL